MADSSLRTQTVSSFKWGLVDNFANSGITFVVGLVLARLLSPSEFGVLGIMTIFINLSVTIIDGGFATAIIRKKDAGEKDFCTTFYVNMLVSIVLMLMLILSSSTIASFFGEPILYETLPAMSVVLLFNATTIIHKSLLIRRLDFRNQAFVSLASSLTSGAFGILAAVYGYGVWALVIQQVSRQFIMMVGLWIVTSWRPKLMFSKDSFDELFGFGSKLLLANVINSLYKDMFLAVIGKIYSTKDLGYYNRSDQFNLIFSNNLGQIVQKVSLSALSRVQDDSEKLKELFRNFMRYVGFGTFAAVFGLAAIAKPLIVVLVGEKWIPSVYYLQIMCLYAAIYPLHQLNLNALNVKRQSNRLLKLEVLKKFLFIPVIAIGFFFELQYMIWAAVVYYYIEFFINGWYSKELIGYGTLDQVKDLMLPYIVSVFISVIVWTITLTDMPYICMLLLQVVSAVILYCIIYTAIKQKEFIQVRTIIISKVKRR